MLLPLLLCLAFAQDAVDLPGRWYPVAYRSNAASSHLSAQERAQIQHLESLGYAAGSEPLAPVTGVTTHDLNRVAAGLNLFSSGHGPYAALVDMDGTVLHTWQSEFTTSFPGQADLLRHESAHSWRRVALLPDGSLLAIHEGIGLVKLDRHSQVVWATLNRAHHDLEVLANGHVLVLTRIAHPQRNGPAILEDFVAELDANGRELRRVSVLKALEQSPLATVLDKRPEWKTGDVLHTNSLQVLDELSSRVNPVFRPGHILLSSRTQGFLAVLDLQTQQFVWTTQGPWSRQHDASITHAGDLMLFDNRGMGPGHSRVLTVDPADESQRVRWSYSGPSTRPLHSEVLGAAQALSNGNVLITESTKGRAVEVTRDGTIVWEFHTPHVVEHRYVAAIYELVRVPDAASNFLTQP